MNAADKPQIREYSLHDQHSFDGELPDSPGRLNAAQIEAVKRILIARGINSTAELNTSLASLENPKQMKGLDSAAKLLEETLQQQKRVLVCGDYDADGATSTALLIRVLTAMGLKKIDFLVPNRFDFGYGLSVELVDVAAEDPPDLIITVDNGISSIDGVAHARAKGMQVLITDHHLPGPALPNANVIVNPNQPGCGFPSKNLAGVGVVFYLLIALRARLRDTGWFAQQSIAEPRLEQYLDLVALGTVADVVVLDRLNRTLVAQGLKLIRSGKGNPGIRNLFAVSGRDLNTATSSDLGFAIGPRINAAGRLDDISQGIACLLSDEEQSAHELALEMHQMNQDRRQIQEHMLAEAERALPQEEKLEKASDQTSMPWGYCCYQSDWHQGLVGLVASGIKEKLHRPVIAFAKADTEGSEPELKGSARSIPGLHIRDCLEQVSSGKPGLIKKFGGHAMAAGLSISEASYEQFSTEFDRVVRESLSDNDLEAITWVDGSLDGSCLSLDFARYLENILPWGQGAHEPQFSGRFRVVDLRWLKETHLKLKLAIDGFECPVEAIWFNAPADVVKQAGDSLYTAYRLSINRYMGSESLQLQIVTGET